MLKKINILLCKISKYAGPGILWGKMRREFTSHVGEGVIYPSCFQFTLRLSCNKNKQINIK